MSLFPGVEREFQIEVDGHKFSGFFPLPSDRRNIDVAIAQRLGGTPLHSIPSDTYTSEFVTVTLNYTLKGRPKEFEEIDFADLPDEDFTARLWKEYSKKEKAYKAGLKKNNRASSSSKTTSNKPGRPSKSVSSQGIPDIAERVPD